MQFSSLKETGEEGAEGEGPNSPRTRRLVGESHNPLILLALGQTVESEAEKQIMQIPVDVGS